MRWFMHMAAVIGVFCSFTKVLPRGNKVEGYSKDHEQC